MTRARADAQRREVDAILKIDGEDVAAVDLRQTPTFFVNGKTLPSFGPEQLVGLVQSELAAR